MALLLCNKVDRDGAGHVLLRERPVTHRADRGRLGGGKDELGGLRGASRGQALEIVAFSTT
jgi:hypothetical protein